MRWYVSSPHRLSADARNRPFGARHAREVGGKFTACGEPALNWPIFWEMPFSPATDDPCELCATAVLGSLAGSPRLGATA